MRFEAFHNALRILRSIDQHEMVAAGALCDGDQSGWVRFRDDPYRWFITANDDQARAVWSIIEQRQVLTEVRIDRLADQLRAEADASEEHDANDSSVSVMRVAASYMERLMAASKAAADALRIYQNGSASGDLAGRVADVCETTLRLGEKRP